MARHKRRVMSAMGYVLGLLLAGAGIKLCSREAWVMLGPLQTSNLRGCAAKRPQATAEDSPSRQTWAQQQMQWSAVALGAGLAAVGGALGAVRSRGAQRRTLRHAGFGPTPYETTQKEDIRKDDVGQRISRLIEEEASVIASQMQQYGFSRIDGFLGGSANGYPDRIRNEMKTLFDRGWFSQESEEESFFKVGQYRLGNRDQDHRFRAKLLGAFNDQNQDEAIRTQYELAPTVVAFTRSLVVSLARPLSKPAGLVLSPDLVSAQMMSMCGNGARMDRRVSQEYGWVTKQGFVRDPRKLCAFYFVNPNWREDLGGHLQLEGVITPNGTTAIEPVHDRLVLFWADKTVWSIRRSQANTVSEHQFALQLMMMAKDKEKIEYVPKNFARWFPELQDRDMQWPPNINRG